MTKKKRTPLKCPLLQRKTLAQQHTKWTPKRREKFLRTLGKWGNVRLAAEAVALSRSRAYELRDEDPQFAAAWDAAVEEAADRLEQEAWRRAVDGWDEPVFGSLGSGEGSGEVGRVRKFSNALLIFLLKGSKPEKYVERVKGELTGKFTGKLIVETVNFADADNGDRSTVEKSKPQRRVQRESDV